MRTSLQQSIATVTSTVDRLKLLRMRSVLACDDTFSIVLL